MTSGVWDDSPVSDDIHQAKFEVGKTYEMHWVSDSTLKTPCTVTKRTEKTVTVTTATWGSKTVKVRNDGVGGEYCYPIGNYSMAPVLRARRVKES